MPVLGKVLWTQLIGCVWPPGAPSALGEMDAATDMYSNVRSATGVHPSAMGAWVEVGSCTPGGREEEEEISTEALRKAEDRCEGLEKAKGSLEGWHVAQTAGRWWHQLLTCGMLDESSCAGDDAQLRVCGV